MRTDERTADFDSVTGLSVTTRPVLAADAEVGRYDRHGAVFVGTRGARGMNRGEADLTPARAEKIRAMGRALHPHLDGLFRRQVWRGPNEVFADCPEVKAARRVVTLDSPPERGSVGRFVLEVSGSRHRARVIGRGSSELARSRQRL